MFQIIYCCTSLYTVCVVALQVDQRRQLSKRCQRCGTVLNVNNTQLTGNRLPPCPSAICCHLASHKHARPPQHCSIACRPPAMRPSVRCLSIACTTPAAPPAAASPGAPAVQPRTRPPLVATPQPAPPALPLAWPSTWRSWHRRQLCTPACVAEECQYPDVAMQIHRIGLGMLHLRPSAPATPAPATATASTSASTVGQYHGY